MQDVSFWLPLLSVVTVRTFFSVWGPGPRPRSGHQTNKFRPRFCVWSEETSIFTNLKLISFLQLVGVLVLAVVHLLPLDVGIHPVLLHVGSEVVQGVNKELSMSV